MVRQRNRIPRRLRRFLVVFVVLVLAFSAYKFYRPLAYLIREEGEVRRQKQTRTALRQEKVQLKKQIRDLKTPEGQELEAKRQGWVKHKEKLIRGSRVPEKEKGTRVPFSIKVKQFFKQVFQRRPACAGRDSEKAPEEEL